MPGNWKTTENESDDDTNCNWWFWYSQRRVSKGTWGLGNKRPSKLLHYWERPEYWEESWRLKETYDSNSSGRRSGNADVKNSQGVSNNNYNNSNNNNNNNKQHK